MRFNNYGHSSRPKDELSGKKFLTYFVSYYFSHYVGNNFILTYVIIGIDTMTCQFDSNIVMFGWNDYNRLENKEKIETEI